MRRRDFIKVIAGSAAAAWPLTARAQQLDVVRRIGVLMGFVKDRPSSPHSGRDSRSLGGRRAATFGSTNRWGAGDADRIRSLARELVDLRPDAIVGQSTPVVAALVRETQTIPIVFVNVADPIGRGFVVSLSRPGSNSTGFMTDNSALGGKWVGLLKEIAPRTLRVALVFNPATAVPLKIYMPSIQAAASISGVEVNATPVHRSLPFIANFVVSAFGTTHSECLLLGGKRTSQ